MSTRCLLLLTLLLTVAVTVVSAASGKHFRTLNKSSKLIVDVRLCPRLMLSLGGQLEYTPRSKTCAVPVEIVKVCSFFASPLLLGPDLQNILRQSYDYLTIMPKLRSTYDGRLIYKTSYKEWKTFHRYDSCAKL